MPVLTTMAAKQGLQLALQWIQKKYPGGILGFVTTIIMLFVMAGIMIILLFQSLMAGLPAGSDSCSAGQQTDGGDGLPAPAGSLIYPVAKGTATMTSGYGPRWGRMHRGQDFGAPDGTPIYAIADGKVMFAGASSGFGQSIWITHNINGEKWTSQYGHMMDGTKFVHTGDTIKVGQKIALVGHNGHSTGPHLHFQIQKGANKVAGWVDPKPWMEQHKAQWITKTGSSGNIASTSFIGNVAHLSDKPFFNFISTLAYNYNVNQGNIRVAVISKSSQLSKTQLDAAKKIISAGKDLKLSSLAWVIAIATAKQESDLGDDKTSLRPNGDHDAGLFQQRVLKGWYGSLKEVTDPYQGAKIFYQGRTAKHAGDYGSAGGGKGFGHIPGLLDVKGWEHMPVTLAAQKVQRSAFPDAYAKWEPLARDVVLKVAGEVAPGYGANGSGESGVDCSEGGDGATGDMPPTDCPAKASKGIENAMHVHGPGYESAKPDTLLVARCAYGTFHSQGLNSIGGPGQRPIPSDHTTGRAADIMIPKWNTPKGNALGNKIATWVLKYRKELGVKYIIWDGHIWNADRGDKGDLPVSKWRQYRHRLNPSGSDPTLTHRDHVHVSVRGNKGTGIKENAEAPGDAAPLKPPKHAV